MRAAGPTALLMATMVSPECMNVYSLSPVLGGERQPQRATRTAQPTRGLSGTPRRPRSSAERIAVFAAYRSDPRVGWAEYTCLRPSPSPLPSPPSTGEREDVARA